MTRAPTGALYMIGKYSTVIVFSLFFTSAAQAWWRKGDAVEVYCENHAALESSGIQAVHLKGHRLSVEMKGRVRVWDTRTFQLSSHKVWDHPQIQLSVALKGWSTYHDATLILKSEGEKFIPLYCYPNKN